MIDNRFLQPRGGEVGWEGFSWLTQNAREGEGVEMAGGAGTGQSALGGGRGAGRGERANGGAGTLGATPL